MRTGAKAAPPEWARKIQDLRHKLNLSQTGFAELLQVSAMAVSRWERGINEPPGEGYIMLGKLAGSPDCWFFWERTGLKRADLEKALAGHALKNRG